MFTVKTNIKQFQKCNSKKRVKVLLNAGGGCFGYIITKFMSSLSQDIYKKIDVVAGTSIGGILALLYSVDPDYNEINTLFKQAVPKIFKKRALGGLRGPMYCNQALKEFMKKIMGEYKLSDINKLNEKDLHIIIPTLDYNLTQPRVFDNIHLDPELDMELYKVGLATAAAPTYFPIIEYLWKINNISKEELESRPINEQIYLLTKQMLEYQNQRRTALADISYTQKKSALIDGGVIQNIPVVTTYTSLRSELGLKPQNIDMFIIGTGNDQGMVTTTADEMNKWSYLDWLTKFLIPYVTCSNESTSIYWGAQMGFNSFCYFNPVNVSGSMDDPKVIKQLEKDVEPHIQLFKKQLYQFLEK